MEQYKITDFNTAFQIGIEKLIYDSINEHSKKDKDPEELKLKKALKIMKKEIFAKLKVQYQDNDKDEDLKWILFSLIDPSKPQKKDKEPKIETERFVTFIHKYYYDQLRLEALTDPQKEEMLYQNAVEIKELEPDIGNLENQEAVINGTMLFDQIDLAQIAVRDNGVMKIERGAAINKKFKYFNNTNEELNIEIISNIPQIQNKRLLLDGYRVIDSSRILVGAFTSLMLADMGAEVIKIEQPGVGDETRKWGPPFRGKDSTYFISINRNKKSMTVDLKHEQGRQIIYDLVGNQRDTIFLSNFTPSRLDQLAINYESLKKLNQSLIYASVQGFPLDSELKDKAAFDLTIQAMSGLMDCTGDPHGSPFKVGYAVTDVLAGMHLLQGVMGAIIHKERTGEGQFVNTSLLEANLYSLCYVVRQNSLHQKPKQLMDEWIKRVQKNGKFSPYHCPIQCFYDKG
ncbi:formyl-transferase [Stylonychia lemnae]|uniref:Formyl-transferase n=1 Tax=Stylonychia lemnae TaxID=5949 RepID=A0A077ZTW3_STYLE|nr:formyl-transferase [Stylonychia lemnae]|eukprot:CDW73014.1 formyl-transferase [Stylonychia lemnae]